MAQAAVPGSWAHPHTAPDWNQAGARRLRRFIVDKPADQPCICIIITLKRPEGRAPRGQCQDTPRGVVPGHLGLASLWNRRKITKKAHAGCEQKPNEKSPVK